MPDTKHDNNLWVWCGRINRLLILIGFAELITAGVIAHELRGTIPDPPLMILAAVAFAAFAGLLILFGRSVPRLLTMRCRPHVAHPCPFCGSTPDGRYGLKCPNGDPIVAADIREWNQRAETITDYLDDRICEYCQQPIIFEGGWDENGDPDYTVECLCASASSRWPDIALHDRMTMATRRDAGRLRNARRVHEAELITAILNNDKDAETRLLAGISDNALNV